MRLRPHEVDLNAILWAIFLAEGGCSASVPFGYKRLEHEWKTANVTAERIIGIIIRELQWEYRRWRWAWYTGKWPRNDVKERDFIRWLARVGYNANPAEWKDWEKNVRFFYARLRRDAVKMLAMGDQVEKLK